VKYKEEYIKYIEDQGNFIEHYGCERCGRTTAFNFSVHHIYYKSEIPNHPNLHDVRNLTWVCGKCHSWYHSRKSNREKIAKERGLKDLFYEIKK